jgi:hypothetical protein
MILQTVGYAAAPLAGATGPSQSQTSPLLPPRWSRPAPAESNTRGLLAGVPAAIELPAELRGRFQKECRE